MLDLGFGDAILALAASMPKARQTLLFSATWPPGVQHVAARLMRASPARVAIGGSADAPTASDGVLQHVHVLMERQKTDLLLRLLAPFGRAGHHAGAPGAGRGVGRGAVP